MTVKTAKTTITARLAVHQADEDRARSKRQVVTVHTGDDLTRQGEPRRIRAVRVEEINAGERCVRFANGAGVPQPARARARIRRPFSRRRFATPSRSTSVGRRICRHHGIKVLTLFFIDRVDNYAQEDGMIRRLFDKAFHELKHRDPDRAGSYAGRKFKPPTSLAQNAPGRGLLEDSETGESEERRGRLRSDHEGQGAAVVV